MSRLKRTLHSLVAAATLFTSTPQPLRAEEPDQFQQIVVGMPEDSACKISLVGTEGSNIVTANSYANGSPLKSTKYDLSNGKAVRLMSSDLAEGKVPTDVTFSGQNRFIAESICSAVIGSYPYTLPDGQVVDVPLRRTITIPAAEFPTEKLFTYSESPAKIFLPRIPANWNIPNKQTISGIVSANMNPANYYLNLTTTQRVPGASNPADHTVYRPVNVDASAKFTLDELMIKPALANSGNGTATLVSADGNSHPEFGYGLFTTETSGLTIHHPIEHASQYWVAEHMFIGNGDWQNGLLLQNSTNEPTITYVRPYTTDGRKLDDVIISIPGGQSVMKTTDDLLKNVKDKEQVGSMIVTSQKPIFVDELYQFIGFQTLAVPAANPLDMGSKLRDATTFGVNENTSFALYNPSKDTQTVRITVSDADGKLITLKDKNGNIVTSKTVDIPSKTKQIGRLDSIMGTEVTDAYNAESFARGMYVTFEDMTPVNANQVDDKYDPSNKVIAMKVRANWDYGLYLTGTRAANLDSERIMFQSSTNFNPRRNQELVELNNGPGTYTITAISDKPIKEASWDPISKGDFTKGYSWKVSNGTPSRMLYKTANTVNGVLRTELPFTAPEPAIIDLKFTPTLTLTTQNTDGTINEYKRKEQMVLLGEEDVYPDKVYGEGYSANLVRNNVTTYAKILFDNRAAINDPTSQATLNQMIGIVLNDYVTRTDGNKTTSVWLWDSGRNTIAMSTEKLQPGKFFAIEVYQNTAGEKLIDDLKQFFRVGTTYVGTPNLQ